MEAAVDVRETSCVDAVAELTDGVGADLVIEAAGYDETRYQPTIEHNHRTRWCGAPLPRMCDSFSDDGTSVKLTA